MHYGALPSQEEAGHFRRGRAALMRCTPMPRCATRRRQLIYRALSGMIHIYDKPSMTATAPHSLIRMYEYGQDAQTTYGAEQAGLHTFPDDGRDETCWLNEFVRYRLDDI